MIYYIKVTLFAERSRIFFVFVRFTAESWNKETDFPRMRPGAHTKEIRIVNIYDVSKLTYD
ncbi:hypothetical protein SY83_12435 [Paenibacillus swuensis]|uniref:Uncharacterized protein n=1 Tax=Paenibacillus swuensis TaxID=1178515 RepID=A0A172TIT3_9BACL|nr:hypothetical protein SY83_12435 [Paenibacillus swuensis]